MAKERKSSRKEQPAVREKLSTKDYEKALYGLHVELVKLQHWVQETGARVCVVFEGRDGAGKGGTIKAITERVSPRVFRVMALPAPTDREKSQMYMQRYLALMPAGGEVVIFDRSWYNRAGVERVMGFCTEEQVSDFLNIAAPMVERGDRRIRGDPAEVLAGGQRGGADPQAQGTHRRRAQALEAVADGPQVVQPLVRLLARPRRHVQGNRHRVRAVAGGRLERQAARAAEHHHGSAQPHSVQGSASARRWSCPSGRRPATTVSRITRTVSSPRSTEAT